MGQNLRWRFALMMFLQYMVWAAWFINLGPYLDHLQFSSSLFSAFFLATLISPFIGGQIADRYMPTQIYMAFSHIIGGILLIVLAKITSYSAMWWILFIYSLAYAPTLALTNSICFHHLKDKTKEFGAIRVGGTIGWIVAGWAMFFWWSYVYPYPGNWGDLAAIAGPERAAKQAAFLQVESWLFVMPGIISILYGFFCFTLPNTPPAKESSNPWAFLDALKMMKDKNFLVFMIICFVVTTQLVFFFNSIPVLLEHLGMKRANISAAQVTAQISEMLTLFLFLQWLLPKLGIQKCMAYGTLAWALLYAAAGLGNAWWLIVPALLLHGIAYPLFFVVGQMYVDTVAPKEIRASAQSLITMVTIGLGMYLSSYFVSFVTWVFTNDAVTPAVVNYHGLFLVPCVLMLVCVAAFFLIFKEPPKQEAQEGTA